MKHVSLFFTTLLLLVPTCLLAQDANKVSAPEPEFVNSYNILTSDSTFDALPKEDGMISKHQNKFGKFAKIAGAASQLVFLSERTNLPQNWTFLRHWLIR